MPKMTVKEFRKNVKAMLDKHKTPPPMLNPIDNLIDMAKKMNNGKMNQ